MAGPFPGMNPYLEDPDTWPDFHNTLYQELKAELNERLPPGFVARVDRYVWVQEPDGAETLLAKPDVYVATKSHSESAASATVATAPPVRLVKSAVKSEGTRYLKVLDARSRRIVTVIEVLSPANKTPGKDHDAYLAKRNEYLGLNVNLVEIDLLRAGARLSWGDEPPARAHYSVLVFRATEFPVAGYWPISVRDTLPEIPIPLTPGIPDVLVSLQTCFDRAFAKGRYEEDFDYSLPPIPPFAEPDAEWVRQRLRSAFK